MNLRKINAVVSLITTVLILAHAIFYSVWMLSRGSTAKPAEMMSWVLVALAAVHAVLSLAMAVLAHKGEEKRAYKTYGKLNAGTMIQRMTGMLMLVLTVLHVVGEANHFQPKMLHAVVHPVFFAVVLAHVAVSGSKAFITLGIGNVKFVKVLDILLAILCGVIFFAGVAGFYLCLFRGVAT